MRLTNKKKFCHLRAIIIENVEAISWINWGKMTFFFLFEFAIAISIAPFGGSRAAENEEFWSIDFFFFFFFFLKMIGLAYLIKTPSLELYRI